MLTDIVITPLQLHLCKESNGEIVSFCNKCLRNTSYEPLCHDWKAGVTNDVISKSAGTI